ncbi:SgcJ/EcaC family oxidoreductase [Embleya sp. NPDC005575]|uniref:SgcJ/EcaC family oxidoreductase n=1 Tax=Embleya sp. NPDC005575 TaxID=3156892 RepID=UPI0033A38796
MPEAIDTMLTTATPDTADTHTVDTTAADTASIKRLLGRVDAAWGQGHGAAYGAGFTADATYITYVGTLYRGGDEIGRAHQALFDSFLKGTRIASVVEEIRFLGVDAAVVVTRGDTYKGDKVPSADKLAKIQTYTVVREPGGDWRVAAFQNTLRKPLMEKVSFRMQPNSRPAEDR